MDNLNTASSGSVDLLAAIRERRERTDSYLRSAGARRRLLINAGLVGAALATFLTAAPAFGGQSFATWLTGVFSLSSPAWRLLCAAAAVCSLAATVATQLLKSHQVDERVAAAQAVRARLEALEIRAGLGQIGPAEAVAGLIKCVEDAAFVWPSAPRPAPAGGRTAGPPARATGRAAVPAAGCACGTAQGAAAQAPATPVEVP
ncbi:hypothetical protein ACQP2F_24440 [Actinoplanes sp. CA-030573]|uniref:hypothetical protein n=1 Tax=Actinoplanes sp. CA-030573 TaxID=3239898 RepID=UPI003D905D37